MRQTKERIVITDGYTLNPGDLSWEALSFLGEIDYYDRTKAREVADRCAHATVIVTNKTPVDGHSIARCPNLKVIAVTATGYNIVDVSEAKNRGILVCNVPGYGTDSVAQHTFALILELTNHVGIHADSVRAGEWSASPDFSYTKAPLLELAGKIMGIIGYGAIGKKVAQIAESFGMSVIYSRNSKGDPNAHSVEDVFRHSDVVSLHCPLTQDNKQFVNHSLLRLMKPGAFLINTARGQLVNEYDLASALRAGAIRGAAVDVLSIEPPEEGNPLTGLANCIVTPHIAWVSPEARRRIMETTVENIRNAFAGTPTNVVN
jgi:glycerate dehydrogenase